MGSRTAPTSGRRANLSRQPITRVEFVQGGNEHPFHFAAQKHLTDRVQRIIVRDVPVIAIGVQLD